VAGQLPVAGNYAITAANAGGGTFDPANYMVVYLNGTLVVFAKAATRGTSAISSAKGHSRSHFHDRSDQ
jgi:hypothetical protein